MRSLLHLATLPGLVLLTNSAAWAQVHSPQVTVHHAPKPEDLSWMNTYAGAEPGNDESRLAADPRFTVFLQHSFTAPQSFWGKDRSLGETAIDFLTGPPGTVIEDENRYLTADACVQEFCPDRGLLWVDLGLANPLVVFAAIDWISENKTVDQTDAAYTMWVFSNRLLSRDHIPPALHRSVARWTARPARGEGALPNVTRAFVVDPDGTPHAVSPAMLGAHNTLPAETSSEMKGQP